MKCGSCKFVLSDKMKYAIKNNVCPSCGESLFTSNDLQMINTLKDRVSGKGFADTLSELDVHDIAMFVFNEFKTGVGRQLLDVELDSIQRKMVDTDGKLTVEAIDEAKAKVRDRIRLEIEQSAASLTTVGIAAGEINDEEEKIERLKAVYRKNKKSLAKPIKRIS